MGSLHAQACLPKRKTYGEKITQDRTKVLGSPANLCCLAPCLNCLNFRTAFSLHLIQSSTALLLPSPGLASLQELLSEAGLYRMGAWDPLDAQHQGPTNSLAAATRKRKRGPHHLGSKELQAAKRRLRELQGARDRERGRRVSLKGMP